MKKCFDECLAPNEADDEEKKMLPINVKTSNTQDGSIGIPYKDIATFLSIHEVLILKNILSNIFKPF